jgi:hypothetical protein
MIPSPAPIAAPVIKPSMVVLVIDGVLLTNIKPAAAIHKVQRTMQIFMGVLPTAARCRYRHWLQVYSKGGNLQSGKDRMKGEARPRNRASMGKALDGQKYQTNF